MPDTESSYLFDLSKFRNLSKLQITMHAMRFPVNPLVKMLSTISDLQNLTFTLFTWRVWRFKDRGIGWDAVDMTIVNLAQAVNGERSRSGGMEFAVEVRVNVLGYGPHDVRDILPRSGERGWVRLVREG
jgi:hypothetical protein